MKFTWLREFDCAVLDSDLSGFEPTIEVAKVVRARNGRVFFIGNGGSAAIASHMSIDWLNKGKFAAMAFNDGAALTCLGNDYGYHHVFNNQLRAHCRDGDMVFAISSSGNSQSIIVPALMAKGTATVVTLTGFAPDNMLRSMGDINFYVPSQSYGVVETAHLAILHAILDRLVD